MRAVHKMELIDKIGRELQSRYRYEEINDFLAEFGIKPPPPDSVGTNSKWVYSKAALRGVSTDTVLKIADELDLHARSPSGNRIIPPRNWKDTTQFRLFISHISKDKDKATRLKSCLVEHSINGFVIHEDIHPTLEWQVEIERALISMDAFIAIHTIGFSQSLWTQQEIGFALGRDVKIISFKMGEDPTGFISKRQALPRRGRTAELVAREISHLLAEDERTATKLLDAKMRNRQTAEDDAIPF
jgi:TIR domain